MRSKAIIIIAVLSMLSAIASAERVKDIVQIKGQRSNTLTGYGLIIGLDGTGDTSVQTKRAYVNYMSKFEGITLDPKDIASKNMASVIVTAELGPFSRANTTIDVTVTAVAAKSLKGGQLLRTQLKGADSQVYALAAGAVLIGGYSVGAERAKITKAHPTVGKIPGGAKIEKEELAQIAEGGKVTLQLNNPDYTTAVNIAEAINILHPSTALANDKGTVVVSVPAKFGKDGLTSFINSIGKLNVKVDSEAVVLINEKTGTIVVGANVTISTVAISHGSLTIVTRENERTVQPLPFSKGGTTEKDRSSDIDIHEGPGRLHILPKPEPLNVQTLAKNLNAMGVTPTDLVAIFQALKAQGALSARLVVE